MFIDDVSFYVLVTMVFVIGLVFGQIFEANDWVTHAKKGIRKNINDKIYIIYEDEE